MKGNSAHKEHERTKKKGSIWLATYKKIQKGARKISETQTFSYSHLKETTQLRFITEFPVAFPLTSLVCKNEYHFPVQSLEEGMVSSLCKQKNLTGPLHKEFLNSFGRLSKFPNNAENLLWA